MYNNYTPNKVLRTTPQRSLEDTLKDTAYSFLSNTLHYVLPATAGLLIGTRVISSQEGAVTLSMLTAFGSGYAQSLNYMNDFNYSIGDSEIGNSLKSELRLRGAIGVLCGVVEGGALLVASGYAGTYFQRALDLAK